MDTILTDLAIMLLVGLIFEKIANKLKLPSVTGYLAAGLLLGPSLLKIVSVDIISDFAIISNLALGFIAFSVGGEFKLSYFRRVGAAPIVIAIFEALGAMLLVTGVMLLFNFDLTFSLVLGAIATATAAASTIMVVKEYNAKGPVTETLLSVVALDDAVCLISFGFAVTIAKAIATGSGSMVAMLLEPFGQIFGSLVTGVVLGFLMKFPIIWVKNKGGQLSVIIAFVALTIAVADLFGFSSLLTCMAMGAMFANVYVESDSIVDVADEITPPLYMIFFVISGAELDVSVLPTLGLVGMIYIVFRVVGKISGAAIAAKIMRAPATVQKYLGATLIPQEGVAIALALLAEDVVPEYAIQIRAIVLCGTFIYGMIGPALTKTALKRAGEID
ncbi:cation:proton antiporter [Candidatus Epulonipiscium viviparus]|uniref:cation:proton antiporter n=1 Tax=Candidatus Epulonipiscium viviparus TaxID=420336 RepID=UPI002738063E|nr:cation:proton antiporter [Candidatus Epulopiscium viviparus]